MHNSTIVESPTSRAADIAVTVSSSEESQVEHVVVEEFIQPIQEVMESQPFVSSLSQALCIVYLIDGLNFLPTNAASFIYSLFKSEIRHYFCRIN